MNAYTWELATQLIALHFTKYQADEMVLTSDCTSAITQSNRALRTRNDQLMNERGGLLATGCHAFADPHLPRQFIHTRAHPERDEQRRLNPTLRDKAICIADAVAGNERAKLGTRTFPTIQYDLHYETILSELIPNHTWHLRTLAPTPIPVLNDILPFQHNVLLHKYTTSRDKSTSNPIKWSSISFAFAHILHPPKDGSFWAAARRTIIAFDWLNHGRNRAKHSSTTQPPPQSPTHLCKLCGLPDSREHCMLNCSYPPFSAIRREAQEAHARLLVDIKGSHTNKQKYFATQFITGAWNRVDQRQVASFWLGLWNSTTLQCLIKQNLRSPKTMSERRSYTALARKLTQPLLTAYYQMLDISASSLSGSFPPYSNQTCTEHSEEPDQPTLLPTDPSPISPRLRDILENTFIQTNNPSESASLLHQIDSVHTLDHFTLSHAAFCSTHNEDSD